MLCRGFGCGVPGVMVLGPLCCGDGDPAGISHLPYLGLWFGVSAPQGAACSVLGARESWGVLGEGSPQLWRPREHCAELPAPCDQAVIVSIMKINWPLLPKINVSVPNPHFNSTSSLEMHIIWLQSHTFQLVINMQLLLALPQSSLQSELLIRLIKLYQTSQGRSSLMLMRQPKQTLTLALMKALLPAAANDNA